MQLIISDRSNLAIAGLFAGARPTDGVRAGARPVDCAPHRASTNPVEVHAYKACSGVAGQPRPVAGSVYPPKGLDTSRCHGRYRPPKGFRTTGGSVVRIPRRGAVKSGSDGNLGLYETIQHRALSYGGGSVPFPKIRHDRVRGSWLSLSHTVA